MKKELINEILQHAEKVKDIDECWAWDVTKLIGIINNLIGTLETSQDEDVFNIACQTRMITDILVDKINIENFEHVRYLTNAVKQLEQSPNPTKFL